MATTKKVLNLNTTHRLADPNFIEVLPVAQIGPLGTAVTAATNTVNTVIWSAVPAMTEDLKNAIISFINQDKTGNSIQNNLFQGRTKVIEFEFQGLPSNIYQFGEIGVIQINMSYPPGSMIKSTPINYISGGQVNI